MVTAVVARLRADTTLVFLLGGSYFYRAAAVRAPQIPSVEYTVVSAVERENTERVLMQFDVWARGYAQALAVEARLRVLLHRLLPEEMEGLLMFAQYADARDHEDPEPGVAHRSVDFAFEPARET